MALDIDYTSPDVHFTFDLNKNRPFIKDKQNYIYALGKKQLNTLDNISLLDVSLSKSNVIEPHYHQNQAELVYCISGSVTVSILNPYTKKLLHFTISPRQVVNVPQGWWHYIVALEDHTHILAIFNAPSPDVILGSDLLKFTPANIIAHTYCVDENQWKKAVAPVKPSTFLGPYTDCKKANETMRAQHPLYNPYYLPSSYYFPHHSY